MQCRAGLNAEPATGLSVAAGWESRSPSEVKSDDQATNPARGGEGAAQKKLKVAVPIAPQPLVKQSLERRRCEDKGVSGDAACGIR